MVGFEGGPGFSRSSNSRRIVQASLKPPPSSRRGLRCRVVVSLAAAASFALLHAPVSSSTVFTYYMGNPSTLVWVGPATYDNDCIWYYGQARCSGGNNWDFNVLFREPGGGTVLVGFENPTRIRGVWSYNGETFASTDKAELGMCCYLFGHTTWWSGGSVYGQAYVGIY